MPHPSRFPFVAALLLVLAPPPASAQDVRIFNTVKTKLEAGQSVIGGSVDTADPEIYCAMANAGFDFLWIEMQHSPITYTDAARMIWACRDGPAIPFIRVPDATEGDIQKAVDIGALGVIVPMVDDAEKIERAVGFAHYPPVGVRSQGGGQYAAVWGSDSRAVANENIMIVAMIESPAGVAAAHDIVSVPGVDIIFAASTDIGSFTGLPQGAPAYESLVTSIEDETLGAGLTLGGPIAWLPTRGRYRFFKGPTSRSLIASGAHAVLEAADPCFGVPAGVAPVEGEDPCPPRRHP